MGYADLWKFFELFDHAGYIYGGLNLLGDFIRIPAFPGGVCLLYDKKREKQAEGKKKTHAEKTAENLFRVSFITFSFCCLHLLPGSRKTAAATATGSPINTGINIQYTSYKTISLYTVQL